MKIFIKILLLLLFASCIDTDYKHSYSISTQDIPYLYGSFSIAPNDQCDEYFVNHSIAGVDLSFKDYREYLSYDRHEAYFAIEEQLEIAQGTVYGLDDILLVQIMDNPDFVSKSVEGISAKYPYIFYMRHVDSLDDQTQKYETLVSLYLKPCERDHARLARQHQ